MNFFIQLHADSADGIMIAYLQSEEMACRYMLDLNTKKSRADFSRETIRELGFNKAK